MGLQEPSSWYGCGGGSRGSIWAIKQRLDRSKWFHLWFTKHFLLYAPPACPLLLLMNGHSSRYCPATIQWSMGTSSDPKKYHVRVPHNRSVPTWSYCHQVTMQADAKLCTKNWYCLYSVVQSSKMTNFSHCFCKPKIFQRGVWKLWRLLRTWCQLWQFAISDVAEDVPSYFCPFVQLFLVRLSPARFSLARLLPTSIEAQLYWSFTWLPRSTTTMSCSQWAHR